jgi:hypothetical protein
MWGPRRLTTHGPSRPVKVIALPLYRDASGVDLNAEVMGSISLGHGCLPAFFLGRGFWWAVPRMMLHGCWRRSRESFVHFWLSIRFIWNFVNKLPKCSMNHTYYMLFYLILFKNEKANISCWWEPRVNKLSAHHWPIFCSSTRTNIFKMFPLHPLVLFKSGLIYETRIF